MAVNGFAWQLGFIVGPAAGAAIMGRALCALVSRRDRLAGALGALALERALPAEHRLASAAVSV